MKRLSVCLVSITVILTIVFSCLLCACGASEKKKSPEELNQMYEQARALSKSGKFKSAFEMYKEIYAYGGSGANLGYPDKAPDEAIKLLEGWYYGKSVWCYSLSLWVSSKKKSLIDPNSLAIYSISIDRQNIDYYRSNCIYKYYIEYGAKNSFGGMNRKTDYYYITRSDIYKDIERIYELHNLGEKGYNNTDNDIAYYVWSYAGISGSSVFSAIVSETCDYYK